MEARQMSHLTSQEMLIVQQIYPDLQEKDLYIYRLAYRLSGTWQDQPNRAVFLSREHCFFRTYCVTLEEFSPDFVSIYDLKLLQRPAQLPVTVATVL
jgi:hypothetical protein